MKTLKLSIIAILILLGNMLYAQKDAAAVSVPITVTDNAGSNATLYFGLDPAATDGIDIALGEQPLPPLPPAGVFDARLNLPVTPEESSIMDYRTGTVAYVGQKTYEVQYQVGTGTSITLSWNLPAGVTGTLKDLFGGVLVNHPMQGTGNYTVTNLAVNKLKMIIDYSLLPNPPSPPNLSSPANNSTGVVLNPTLTWEASSAATSYHVIVATNNAFTNVVFEDTNVTGLTKQLSNLNESTVYYWKVRAKNVAGNSAFSGIWSFTTGSKPTQVTLQSPQNNATGVGLTPTLEWSAATGTLPITYNLELATDVNFNTIVITQSGLNTNSFNVVSPLTHNTAYWWRVKAVNSFGNGLVSTVWSFRTIAQGTVVAVSLPLMITDNAGSNATLYFGLDPAATDGIDIALGEQPLPPLPPAGVFDARLNLPVTPEESSIRDYRNGTTTYVGQKTYEVQYQVGTGTSITLSWSLPAGVTGTLKDLFGGVLVNHPMQGTGNYTVTNLAVNKLKMIIDYNLAPPPLFTTLWQNSAANGNLPTWFSTSHLERGVAYGRTNPSTEVNDRLYIASRNGGNFIRVVNAETGSDVDTLRTTGISGGTYLINDVETTEDGRIFVCNLTLNASTSAFKVYMWENESSIPVAVVNWTGTDAVRLGDKFTVTGRFSDNSAAIYAASATAGFMKVYKWTMTSGAFNANPEVIMLSDNQSGTPSSASVGPLPNGDFYWKATGFRLKKYTATGTLIDTIPGAVISTASNAVRYIGKVANKEYVAVFQYGAGNENARIVEIENGNYSGAVTYAITPTLGTNTNTNGAGDISVKYNTDGTVIIFILSTNNGFGSYSFLNIPIELASFTASSTGNGVVLNWTTATETNSKEFVIERSGSDAQWSEIGKVNASGTSTSPVNYSYMDNSVNSGKLIYRLKMVDFDGTYKYSQEVSVEVGVPDVFSLSQNYPNPFNPSTRIQFRIPVNASVTLELFDITGQKIATLINQDIQAGFHIYDLEANRFGIVSGVYLYRLIATDKSTSKTFTDTRKLMMLK